MKSRVESEFIRVFTYLHENLLTRGINSAYMRLYNEASTALQIELKAKNIDFQLSPPGIHIRIAAEREIRTFKDHFIAGVCSTYTDFPMQNWDHLI